MIKRLTIFIFIFLFTTPMSTIFAEGEINTENKELETQDYKAINSPASNSSIVDNIEPVSIERISTAIENKGQELYNLLQSFSTPLFVVGLGSALFILFLGIFFKKLRTAGIVAIVITFICYLTILYAPEIKNLFINEIENFKDSI
ncbi:hypothetical protein [Chengkuizengella axinellae]|uniref:DUF4064 domain-containing protein n=1 Tax=Chengkuizengella axinellae TaxID=3064388 RepID=A0ABT9J3D2_9BACL|nr:hypothetical protein [Chengkuizengella sp. 2205SS18-9]MDP5276130.1 hypothetical protein [Chengkuizengella sp. 2205SS18-9]